MVLTLAGGSGRSVLLILVNLVKHQHIVVPLQLIDCADLELVVDCCCTILKSLLLVTTLLSGGFKPQGGNPSCDYAHSEFDVSDTFQTKWYRG